VLFHLLFASALLYVQTDSCRRCLPYINNANESEKKSYIGMHASRDGGEKEQAKQGRNSIDRIEEHAYYIPSMVGDEDEGV